MFSPPELRQPPATVAGGIVNGATQAQNVQSLFQDLANSPPPSDPFGGPSSPLSSTSQDVGVITHSNPKTPPLPVQIGNGNNPSPAQNPDLPPAADLALQAAQQVPDIAGIYASNIADFQQTASEAQFDTARAVDPQRQIALASQQSSAIQIAAAAASATVNAVAAKVSVPGGPSILTVSDAGGNVLFRRAASDAEVAAARAAADEALREVQGALARLVLDQSIAGQPLGLDSPKGDMRTVDPRGTAEFNALNLNVQNPVPQIPAFVVSGHVPDFAPQADLPAFDSPILPQAVPAPSSHNPHHAA